MQREDLQVQQPQRTRVDGDTGKSDEPEEDHPRPCPGHAPGGVVPLPCDLQPKPCQVTAEVQDLTDGRLALTCVPRGEAEADLRGAQARVADDQLEKDLVAVRPQALGVHRGEPDGEEAAHRIAHPGRATGEGRLGHPGGESRTAPPRAAVEPRGTAVAGVPAGDHEVDRLPSSRVEQLRYDLRGVLQIRVHHQCPGTSGCPHPADDGGAQAAGPVLGRPRQKAHRSPSPAPRRAPARRVVVGIVDEDDLAGSPRRPPTSLSSRGFMLSASLRVGMMTVS